MKNKSLMAHLTRWYYDICMPFCGAISTLLIRTLLKYRALFVAANVVFFSIGAAAQLQTELPIGVQRLIYAEQHLLSRDVNERRIMTPHANFQDDKYKPENSQTFEVKSFWVSQADTHYFESKYVSKNIQSLFVRDESGQKQVLMLIHPESEDLFRDFLIDAKPGPRFWATSTASSRTLLMWPEGRPKLAFFGKLSLNKKIGGVVRTIPQGEVARSLGTNEVLYMNKNFLPENFHFMPESISMIPRGFERGGMIIREIPADVASGKNTFIPLFSLYADRGEQMPLLAEMINKSGQPADIFVKNNLIDPFVKQWMVMVLLHGISMEPHAQNVLIGLDAHGMPNGQFMHRDFGGFSMNLEKFKVLGTLAPETFPTITNVSEDYHQRHTTSSINQALEVYFDQGFVFNLDQKLPTWVKMNWIMDYAPTSFSKMIYNKVSSELVIMTENRVSVPALNLQKEFMEPQIEKARQYVRPAVVNCRRVFLD